MPTEADERALTLLRTVLPREACQTLDADGSFVVEGSAGGRYQLRVGRSGNVQREHDGKVTRFCIHPVEAVPDADTVLAQVLLLWTDEPAFLSIANQWSYEIGTQLAPVGMGPRGGPPRPPPTVEELPLDGGPILPNPMHPDAMRRLRLIKVCLQTPEGREALAQAVLARIRYGGPGTEDVAREVTQFAQAISRCATEPEPTRGILDVRVWLDTGRIPARLETA
jgi:hypothetical protein